jgi:hypothetical protein
MPFPRVKGQVFPFDNRLPLAIRWGKGIKNPGRIINDYVSFSDFAPTFLDLAGINSENHTMKDFSGISWISIFNEKTIAKKRDYIIIGKERHDVGRENDQGYPVRAIIAGQYFYSINFKPERWPAGNPETGYLNTDGSPTKTEILKLRKEKKTVDYWNYAFGKRPKETLYDLKNDPNCIKNIVKNDNYNSLKDSIREILIKDLTKNKDPRVIGNGNIFDNYIYAEKRTRNFYKRYMSGELLDSDWVNSTDFESDIK